MPVSRRRGAATGKNCFTLRSIAGSWPSPDRVTRPLRSPFPCSLPQVSKALMTCGYLIKSARIVDTMTGTKLAYYEITSHLGSGGMGEVYQATDTKLGRSVAIKFLPEAFSHDAERVARFQREARVLASLNHSNIAAIHGLEEINSAPG